MANKKVVLSFVEARKIVRLVGLKGVDEWREWFSKTRPKNIPSNPWVIYKWQWKGFCDWMGFKDTRRSFLKKKKRSDV